MPFRHKGIMCALFIGEISIETGTIFIKDGKRYHLPKKQVQSEMAYKSGMNCVGKQFPNRRENYIRKTY